jgi:hypothetical protein
MRLCQSLALCVDAWHDYTSEEVRKRYLTRISMRMAGSSLAKAFKSQWLAMCVDAWHDYTCGEARKRTLAKRIAMRLTVSLLEKAFERWGDSVDVMKQERDEEERMHRLRQCVMQRIVKRMTQKGFKWHPSLNGEKITRQVASFLVRGED